MRFADFLTGQTIIKPQRFVRKPLVSVIMPTYCRAHDGLLSRAITSVLGQTFADFEFIIVDDGSTDGSEEIIREFQKQDDRILYVRHEINSGLPALRVDEGILLSRAEYLAFEFDDDEWLPLFLQTVTSEAVKHNKVFVHCQAQYFLGERIYHPAFPSVQHTYASLLQGNQVTNASVLVHRSALMRCGLYDPHVVIRRLTDWDLWLRIARDEPPYLVREVLVKVHGELRDSLAVKAAPWIGEGLALYAQLPRNSELLPEHIMDYEVVALDRCLGKLPGETIGKFYHYAVMPWLTNHTKEIGILGLNIQVEYLQKQAKELTPQRLRLSSGYQKVIDRVLPWGTRRRHYYELALTGIKIILTEGCCSFWTKFKRWVIQQASHS